VIANTTLAFKYGTMVKYLHKWQRHKLLLVNLNAIVELESYQTIGFPANDTKQGLLATVWGVQCVIVVFLSYMLCSLHNIHIKSSAVAESRGRI
jgi:hypothetical protein